MAKVTLFSGVAVKNADVTIQTAYNGYVNGAYIEARYTSSSTKYRIGGNSYDQKLSVLYGSTVIAQVSQQITAGAAIRVLFVDNSLKVYYDGVLKIDITTDHNLIAGAWSVDPDSATLGTSISSTNLDSAAGSNMQLQVNGIFKTVESVQIQVGGIWKAVSGVQIDLSSTWKTLS